MDVIVPLYPEIGDTIKTMGTTPVISFTNRSIISWKQFTGIPFLDNQLDTGKVNYISIYTHVFCIDTCVRRHFNLQMHSKETIINKIMSILILFLCRVTSYQ